MQRVIDRFMTHPAFRIGLLVAVVYTGYLWWRAGDWVWFLGCLMIAVGVERAADREKLRQSFEDPSPEATKPSLWVRFAGHPMIAWPMLFAHGFILFGGLLVGWNNSAVIDGYYALTFGLFLVIFTLFAGWTAKRCNWKWNLPKPTKSVAPRQVQKAPLAQVIVPSVPLGTPSIPDAMRHLPPGLLDLVKEGMSIERAHKPA